VRFALAVALGLIFTSAGASAQFDASGVRLGTRLSIGAFPGANNTANDVWGYVSPSGREYAIIGFRKGTGFADVTDPDDAFVVDYIDGGGVNEVWRDMAVYREYAYIVSDDNGVGIQIADLSRIDEGIVTLAATTHIDMGFKSAHNVFINEDSATLYLAIPNTSGGVGITAVSLAVPTDPVFAGIWGPAGVRCHDLQVVTYPAGHFLMGREIAFCFAESEGVMIVDVGDKENMFFLRSVSYPNQRYTHQGWLSADYRHLFVGDEADEEDDPDVTTTTTYVLDVEFLLQAKYLTAFTNGKDSIDHNLMVRGDLLFEANYTTGLRVFDVSDVEDVVEVGWFDTYPSTDARAFIGAWGVYAGLPSGTILVSDTQRGLFVLDATELPEPAAPGLTAAAIAVLAWMARVRQHPRWAREHLHVLAVRYHAAGRKPT
jgi:choice-of-anchor B domain-containing protein